MYDVVGTSCRPEVTEGKYYGSTRSSFPQRHFRQRAPCHHMYQTTNYHHDFYSNIPQRQFTRVHTLKSPTRHAKGHSRRIQHTHSTTYFQDPQLRHVTRHTTSAIQDIIQL